MLPALTGTATQVETVASLRGLGPLEMPETPLRGATVRNLMLPMGQGAVDKEAAQGQRETQVGREILGEGEDRVPLAATAVDMGQAAEAEAEAEAAAEAGVLRGEVAVPLRLGLAVLAVRAAPGEMAFRGLLPSDTLRAEGAVQPLDRKGFSSDDQSAGSRH